MCYSSLHLVLLRIFFVRLDNIHWWNIYTSYKSWHMFTHGRKIHGKKQCDVIPKDLSCTSRTAGWHASHFCTLFEQAHCDSSTRFEQCLSVHDIPCCASYTSHLCCVTYNKNDLVIFLCLSLNNISNSLCYSMYMYSIYQYIFLVCNMRYVHELTWNILC